MKLASSVLYVCALAAISMTAMPTQVEAGQQLRQAADFDPAFLEGSSGNKPALLEGSSSNKPALLQGSSGNKPALLQGSSGNKPAAMVDSFPGAKPSFIDGAGDGEPPARRLNRWCNRWPIYCPNK